MTQHKIQTANYPIFIDEDLNAFEKYINAQSYTKILIIVDENTKAFCLKAIQERIFNSAVYVHCIQSGEENKVLSTCQDVWAAMLSIGLDRKSLTINLGGGVIGDMAGFCASTYMRGIDFIQIPTTLLSQVDASIGGKLGVDFKNLKNMIGLFNHPSAIFIHYAFLNTLKPEELISGYAEMIKHALIGDTNQWEKLKSIDEINPKMVENYIYDSILIKKNIVEKDPRESTIRKYLNFGHTLGHALESARLASGNKILHGEAVGAGMILEAFISYKKLNLDPAQLSEISQYLSNIYGILEIDDAQKEELMRHIRSDKKNEGDKILMVGLANIGEPILDVEINRLEIMEAIEYYLGLS